MKTKIALFSLLLAHTFTGFTPVKAKNSICRKAGKLAVKTLKVASHLIELGAGIWGIFDQFERPTRYNCQNPNHEHTNICKYGYRVITSTVAVTLIANGLRGLKNEFNIGRKKTFTEKLKSVVQN